MRKTTCLCMCLVFLVLGPAQIGAQEWTGGLDGLTSLVSPALSNMPSWSMGTVKVAPYAGFGYQWLGLNFNMPAFDSEILHLPAPMDMKIKGGRFGTLSAGLDASIPSGLSLFLRAEANIKRDVKILTAEEPVGELLGFARAAEWTGSGLQWWLAEGGLGYQVACGVSVLAGVRRDSISLQLSDPRDASGAPIEGASQGLGVVREFGDFTAGLWVPYVGLRFEGPNYRTTLLASPYTRGSIKLPDCFMWTISFPPFFTYQITNSFEYSVSQPGGFFEGAGEYDVNLNQSAVLRIWGKGNYAKIRGSGNLDELFQNIGGASPGTWVGSESATATFVKSTLSAGLSAVVAF
jgi:hypothetical protein